MQARKKVIFSNHPMEARRERVFLWLVPSHGRACEGLMADSMVCARVPSHARAWRGKRAFLKKPHASRLESRTRLRGFSKTPHARSPI